MQIKHFIIATAGHVDHGKSALVRALTGIDPDRLPEEKARGITIDLGFANLDLPTGATDGDPILRVGIIDVPGHEDFVRNMVAGMAHVDAGLLVVAADDGWMPQTEEHFQILNYLNVFDGVVALTKCDLVSDLAPVRIRIREQLSGTRWANAPLVETAFPLGRGVDAVKAAITDVLKSRATAPDLGKPRLSVDRVFSLPGIGAIVTGTLIGGALNTGETMSVHPGGERVKIRALQSYGRPVPTAAPGSRVAINLPGATIRKTAGDAGVGRQQTVAARDSGAASDALLVQLETTARAADGASAFRHDGKPPQIRSGMRVNVHIGTARVAARVTTLDGSAILPGGIGLARLTCEGPVYCFLGDRFLIRDVSGRKTLAGGVVLDPRPAAKTRPSADQLTELRNNAAALGDMTLASSASAAEMRPSALEKILTAFVRMRGTMNHVEELYQAPFSSEEIRLAAGELAAANELVCVGDILVAPEFWTGLMDAAAAHVAEFHRARPEQTGAKTSDLRALLAARSPTIDLSDAVIQAMTRNGYRVEDGLIRAVAHQPALPPELAAAGNELRGKLAERPFDPPSRADLTPDKAHDSALRFMLNTGEAVAISPQIVMASLDLARARETLAAFITRNGPSTLSALKQALGTSRRVMVPLAEYLDARGFTSRRGDLRVLRVAASPVDLAVAATETLRHNPRP